MADILLRKTSQPSNVLAGKYGPLPIFDFEGTVSQQADAVPEFGDIRRFDSNLLRHGQCNRLLKSVEICQGAQNFKLLMGA